MGMDNQRHNEETLNGLIYQPISGPCHAPSSSSSPHPPLDCRKRLNAARSHCHILTEQKVKRELADGSTLCKEKEHNVCA